MRWNRRRKKRRSWPPQPRHTNPHRLAPVLNTGVQSDMSMGPYYDEEFDTLSDDFDLDDPIPMGSPNNGPTLPIFDPRFNMREVCKQLVLLEDHLFQPEKHCPDCVRKHLMAAEAYAEEAVTLDKHQQFGDVLGGLADEIRGVCDDYYANPNRQAVAQKARAIRKRLSKDAFGKGKGRHHRAAMKKGSKNASKYPAIENPISGFLGGKTFTINKRGTVGSTAQSVKLSESQLKAADIIERVAVKLTKERYPKANCAFLKGLVGGLVTNAWFESGLVPGTNPGDAGWSHGLFQLHLGARQGGPWGAPDGTAKADSYLKVRGNTRGISGKKYGPSDLKDPYKATEAFLVHVVFHDIDKPSASQAHDKLTAKYSDPNHRQKCAERYDNATVKKGWQKNLQTLVNEALVRNRASIPAWTAAITRESEKPACTPYVAKVRANAAAQLFASPSYVEACATGKARAVKEDSNIFRNLLIGSAALLGGALILDEFKNVRY